MFNTFTEATKCLGLKSRDSIYQLNSRGVLDAFKGKFVTQISF